LVQLCFDFYMIEAKPENLIGDGAYDSDRATTCQSLLRHPVAELSLLSGVGTWPPPDGV
jgi:hypothetical protein